MKKDNKIVVSISSMNDIDKLTDKTKYINLDITNCDFDVINFFIKNGENYLYSEIIQDKPGYIYVSYQDFLKSENIISGIYASMPNDLSPLEMARYLYVSIPKYVCLDINLDREKNELLNLNLINCVNNLWGSIALGRVNDKSISKIYYYLCRRMGIDVSLMNSNITHDTYTELHIARMAIITDLFNDLPFIQAGMKTLHFGNYNDEVELDKKVKYIKNKYNDELIDKALKDIDYRDDMCVEVVLAKTERILPIDIIKPVELAVIYTFIFNKYCSNCDIKINNLFLNNKERNHFIVISYNDEHYSYNYKKKIFVRIENKDIKNNINIGKIGIYMDEFIPNIS